MTRITILQHSPFEPLGIMINIFKQYKIRLRYINFYRDPIKTHDLTGYQGLVILGGNMNPDEIHCYPHLAHEIELIKQAFDLDIPVLGICLGSQLMTLALGGQCYRLDNAEFGWTRIEQVNYHPLFSNFNYQNPVFQWHQYASYLAPGAKALFGNETCLQAFSFEQKHIGIQFHLEVDKELISRWLEHPDYLTHLKAHIGIDEIERIKQQTQTSLKQSMQSAQSFFNQFCLMLTNKQKNPPTMHAGR